MHDIGGHIASELFVEGKWAYMDPRAGVYCLKADGSFASTWEIWQTRRSFVSRPISQGGRFGKMNWEERVWKCENKFFHPMEVNGLQNYSLAIQSSTTCSETLPKSRRRRVVHRLASSTTDYQMRSLDWRPMISAYLAGKEAARCRVGLPSRRFSMYFYPEPPMTRQQLFEDYVDPFRGGHTTMLVWGLGPGSVFCYDTKVARFAGRP